MQQDHHLKEQAALLRGVAKTFDIESIRDRLLAIASKCEQLAGITVDLANRKPPRP